MPTDLQARAERAARLFAEKARKPLVVEFAGVPKAGKTTTLAQVQTFLKRCGFRTDVVVERASVCPIRDKKHANFNVWTACTTLAQVLEKTQNPPRPDDPHILFLDRGLFDSICWMTMMEQISRVRAEDRELIERFLMIDDWRKRISAVFVMLASPKDSMSREQGLLPVKGAEGSIMNPQILEKIKAVTEQCIEQLGRKFRLFPVNTSVGETKGNPERTAEVVVETILALAEGHVEESILSCPKREVTELFGGRCFVDEAGATGLARTFGDGGGSYRPRNDVERDNTVVQALPIVVVRNADGDVLRLRRREKSPDNPLHEKVVIWAGGHVRCEDAVNGDPLLHCAARELEEELRLQVAPSALRLIGAVYFGNGESTSRHVGIAYEWRASTNDVSAVLSRSEFFEKSGTSLSGSFCPAERLAKDVRCNQLTEPWSVELIRNALAKDGMADLLTRDNS